MKLKYCNNYERDDFYSEITLNRRKSSTAGHMLIFGDPGYGKHFIIKREMIQILENSDDYVYVVGESNEYTQFSKYVNFHYISSQHISGTNETDLTHILEEGRKICDSKRIWLYIDGIDNFTKEQIDLIYQVMKRARKAEVIMTMTSISLTKDTVVLLSNVEYYFILHSKEEAINQFLNYRILECNSEFQADDWFSYLENVNPGEGTMISYDQCVLLSDKFKFEHKEKDALIAFLLGNGTDNRGRYLSDLWKKGYFFLETSHDYIQWMFPLDTKSQYNSKAPVLNNEEIIYI